MTLHNLESETPFFCYCTLCSYPGDSTYLGQYFYIPRNWRKVAIHATLWNKRGRSMRGRSLCWRWRCWRQQFWRRQSVTGQLSEHHGDAPVDTFCRLRLSPNLQKLWVLPHRQRKWMRGPLLARGHSRQLDAAAPLPTGRAKGQPSVEKREIVEVYNGAVK